MEPRFRFWKLAFHFLKPPIKIISHSEHCHLMTECIYSWVQYVKYNQMRTILPANNRLSILFNDIIDSTSDRFFSKSCKIWKTFVLFVTKITLVTSSTSIYMCSTGWQNRYYIFVLFGANHFCLLLVWLQYLSKHLLRTVQLAYTHIDCTECTDFVSRSPSLQLITHRFTSLQISPT